MTRGCAYCGTPFKRKRTEASWRFKMRRYCTHKCYCLAKTQGDSITARVRRVLAYDPDLETWQLAERFGVDVSTADNWRRRYLRREEVGGGEVLVGARMGLTTAQPSVRENTR